MLCSINCKTFGLNVLFHFGLSCSCHEAQNIGIQKYPILRIINILDYSIIWSSLPPCTNDLCQYCVIFVGRDFPTLKNKLPTASLCTVYKDQFASEYYVCLKSDQPWYHLRYSGYCYFYIYVMYYEPLLIVQLILICVYTNISYIRKININKSFLFWLLTEYSC